MDYLQMLCGQNPQKNALIVDGERYTYGELVRLAHEMGEKWHVEGRKVRVIKEKDILKQLVSFLACYAVGVIPLLVPSDSRNFTNGSYLTEPCMPEHASMAVATSGTTGIPKIYFRSYESWAGYFPIQNEIFHLDEGSRLFVQGSLAFTGNLNLYMAVFYAGGTIVAENAFKPWLWEERMLAERVNGIYLIPSKLLLIPTLFKEKNRAVRTIISGSQSLGKEDAVQLEGVFPNTKLILYYGASELNYITYVTAEEMNGKRNLIGKPFPEVEVFVQDGELFVNTEYHVEGIQCPYSLSDGGFQDEQGNFYFLGRKDDMLNVRGRKVSSIKIENALEALPEVQEAAVLLEAGQNNGAEEQIVAYIVPARGEVTGRQILEKLRTSLEHFEMPKRLYPVESLPKNESGKVDKKRFSVLQ